MGYDKAAWQPRDYKSFDELSSELDRFEVAHRAGKLSTTGTWSAGQIFEHCAKLIACSIDGFGAVDAPWFVKAFCKVVFKPRLGKSHMKPGIKLPAKASSMLPDESISFEDGLRLIREQVARIKNGEQMTHDSPILGKMRHDQWVLLQLDHCRMHFGYIKID